MCATPAGSTLKSCSSSSNSEVPTTSVCSTVGIDAALLIADFNSNTLHESQATTVHNVPLSALTEVRTVEQPPVDNAAVVAKANQYEARKACSPAVPFSSEASQNLPQISTSTCEIVEAYQALLPLAG
eukprot:CAMPEP_0115604528 /NCGR_PEP_ID=MMETSP0272-20121206/16990_1 /TAXON_ID=71861 /ORGANISM="Scrippsiella trochoidea, Strain CCMP3099" /LENGTH=127 /DNA_ID=CAMNT_0003040085 /DNA_START=788 /DNA_END=1169 /DNA_ORIENTATION=+